MRGFSSTLFLLFALSACGSLPAPYQTYSPGEIPLPPTPNSALVVYGSTTTSPEMVPDAAEIQPVPTPAQSASTSQKSSGVAICYNRLWNAADTVKNAAAQACGNANSSPRVTTQGIDLDACPLLTPTKAVFACPSASGTP